MPVYNNKDIKRTINKKDIVICPLVESSITPLGYDISIGEIITLSSESGNKLAKVNGKIEIPAKSLSIVIAKEFIWLSGNVVGTLHSRGTLACKGIFTNSTNVDPNFGGQMVMSIYNTTDRTVVLDEDAPFITLIFHSTLTFTPDGPGEKKTSRVLAELKAEYGSQEIDKLNDYMNAQNTANWDKFTGLIFQCKNRNFIKVVKDYVSAFKSNHSSSILSWIFDIVLVSSIVFLMVSLGRTIYYVCTGDTAKAWSEIPNLYVLLAAFLAIRSSISSK